MEKKQLYMIGNSHIDPVWFWNWEEGMQEVKATYASALDRMKEFEDFKFTSTSTAFFQWIEKIVPDMFEEIKERVAQGRWEITGGWFIEPDCILPSGESFVRQGLYGQRYLKDRFGVISKIGSNVDSFGHNHVLPQILKKSGMDAYVFMRPRIETPVFLWEGEDGSRVNAISLPGEYTTWFHDPTVKNIKDTIERSKGFDNMVCCYGVGNHGGGPTIENIKSIQSLKDSFPETTLKFSTFTEFLEDTKKEDRKVISGPFEKINQGCYSIDAEFKRIHRLAETRLIAADNLMSMAREHTGTWLKESNEMEQLWNVLHFNQFHDTMGGTTIKSAREEAIMQMGGVAATAGYIKNLAIQEIANHLDTTGIGYPLILFNPSGQGYQDYVEVELEWFCQDGLSLSNPEGDEIPYQRIYTDVKVRHTVLGGRRRIVFLANIPAYGYAVYRVTKESSVLCSTPNMEIMNPNPYRLENDFILAKFDEKTGQLISLVDKKTGYDALFGPSSIRIFMDERDDWGGLQGRRYEDLNESFVLESIEKVESGELRQAIRVRLRYGETRLEQLFYLGAIEEELHVECRLCFNHRWRLLKMAFDTGEESVHTKAESAYGTLYRNIEDEDEYYMQRFLDITDENGRGLAISNDQTYAFNMAEHRVQITLARSAIYAQGNSPEWYNHVESYQYTDIGMHTYHFVLKPHGKELPSNELYRIAKKVNGAYEYLADHQHQGKHTRTNHSLVSASASNVEIMVVKKCEDSDAYIVRMVETKGINTSFSLSFCQTEYQFTIGHHEILTVKIGDDQSLEVVNLIEWENFEI